MSAAIHAMEITIEPGAWGARFKATCSDPTADCHYICADRCESWVEIIRNEDGRVLHHQCESGAIHHMEHVQECNYIGFLNNSDEVQEDMTGKPLIFTTPAVFTYDGEAVSWEVAQ